MMNPTTTETQSRVIFPIQLADGIELRPLCDQDADPMFSLISANRDHLDRWLRWSGRVQTVEHVHALINRFAEKYALGDGFHAGLWLEGQLAGGIVCHYIDEEDSNTEIGYWLGAAFTGKGLITRACREVISQLFERVNLRRIEIIAAVNNVPSRAVAERLGFQFEGVKRESIKIGSEYRDHALYSLLSHEWTGSHRST
jgi:ribosomal-protein-serine acetyltransferase